MRLYPPTRRRGLKVQSVLTDNGKDFCGAEGSRPCRLDAGQLGERNPIRDKLGAEIRADDLHLLTHPPAIPIIACLIELWWMVLQRSEQMRKVARDGHTFALRGVQARVAGNAPPGSSSSRVSGSGHYRAIPG